MMMPAGKSVLFWVALALFPSLSGAFSTPGVAATVGSCSSAHKISSCAASANDGDLFFDESSSEKDSPSTNNQDESLGTSTSQFAQGKELQQIRIDLDSHRENLKWAQAVNDTKRIESLRQAIEETELKDPEIVYKKALFLIAEAKSTSSHSMHDELKDKLVKHWKEQAENARSYLPRFQMDGVSIHAVHQRRGTTLVFGYDG